MQPERADMTSKAGRSSSGRATHERSQSPLSPPPVDVPNATVASINDYIARAGRQAKTVMASPPIYEELVANSDPRDWIWWHGHRALYRGASVHIHDEWSWGWMVRKADGSFVERASGMEAPSGGETSTEIEGSTVGDSPTGEAGDAQGPSQ